MLALFLLTSSLFLVHPLSLGASIRSPRFLPEALFLRLLTFLLSPMRSLKTLLGLLSFFFFFATNVTFEISNCLREKSGLKVWVNISHLFFFFLAQHSITVLVISWGFKRDVLKSFVQFVELFSAWVLVSNNLAYCWMWDSISVNFSFSLNKNTTAIRST